MSGLLTFYQHLSKTLVIPVFLSSFSGFSALSAFSYLYRPGITLNCQDFKIKEAYP